MQFKSSSWDADTYLTDGESNCDTLLPESERDSAVEEIPSDPPEVEIKSDPVENVMPSDFLNPSTNQIPAQVRTRSGRLVKSVNSLIQDMAQNVMTGSVSEFAKSLLTHPS